MAYKIGLDIDLFWQLNPARLKPFVEAYEQKLHEERDSVNQQAYLIGAYVQYAIASCFSKEAKYPDKPFDIKDNKEIEEWKSSDAYKEQERLIVECRIKQDERRKRKEEQRNAALREVALTHNKLKK